MTSFAAAQPESLPVRLTPMSFGPGVERPAGHHVDGVRTAHADRDHAEAAGVRRVAVGADHHPAGERVLLEHDLVDDPRAGLPEADAVLRRHRAQELVDLGVGVERRLEVDVGADVRLDEVVAVHGRGHRDLRQAGGHELEQRHLRGGVLHRDAVGAVVGVVDAAIGADGVGIGAWAKRTFSAKVSGRPRRLRRCRPAPGYREYSAWTSSIGVVCSTWDSAIRTPVSPGLFAIYRR